MALLLIPYCIFQFFSCCSDFPSHLQRHAQNVSTFLCYSVVLCKNLCTSCIGGVFTWRVNTVINILFLTHLFLLPPECVCLLCCLLKCGWFESHTVVYRCLFFSSTYLRSSIVVLRWQMHANNGATTLNFLFGFLSCMSMNNSGSHRSCFVLLALSLLYAFFSLSLTFHLVSLVSCFNYLI